MSSMDLEKFIKFLALKSTQVVVQSRLAEKIKTQCNPLATGSDWFNIVVQDHPDVYAETKRALALAPGESILQRLPLCVEISLKTVEGDQMVLEVWSLDLQQYKDMDGKTDVNSKNESAKLGAGAATGGGGGGTINSNSTATEQQTLKTAQIIYSRMGILLRSLISLTRATPAYKLSRRQCPESYVIYYRIYVDRPQIHTLGDGHEYVRIGQLNTVVGALSMSVSYRTKMTITPTAAQVRTGDGIMLKSDHFRPSDATPKQQKMCNAMKKGAGGANAERKVIDIEKPLRPGAFTDINKIGQCKDDKGVQEKPPFEWLLNRTYRLSGGSGSIDSLNSPPTASPLGNGYPSNSNANNNCNAKITNSNAHVLANNNNNEAFKSFENDENSQNSQKSPANSTLSQSPMKSLLIPAPLAARHGSTPNLPPANPPPDDDNLLKELNFPFASPTSHVNDLAKFYRDCYNAPPLRGLNEIQSETAGGCGAAASTVTNSNSENTPADDLSRQLEQFETSLEDYDKLVSQFGLTTSTSTGSRSSGGLQMSN